MFRAMNYTAMVVPALLAAGCSSYAPLPTPMDIDHQPAKARASASGTRAGLDVTLDPEAATLAGEPLGRLAFHVDLAGAIDCPGECLKQPIKVALDGQATTGSFELGSSTYDIGPNFDPTTNRYVFVEAGDPLRLPRGSAAALFEFYHLDASGASFQILLAPLFGVGLPDPSAVHVLATGGIDVDFEP
jgi:hypothetical protein